MMKLWKFWEHDKCPCCQEPGETTTHLIWCADSGMANRWEESLEELEEWMSEEETDPDIMECILTALKPREPMHFSGHCEGGSAKQAAASQDEIGWYHFVEGKIAKSWEQAQHEYYMTKGSTKLGRGWAAGLAGGAAVWISAQPMAIPQ